MHYNSYVLFIMCHPRPLYVYFCYFQTNILQKQNAGVSMIWTRFVGVEGKHTDHLATTTTVQ